MKAELLPLILTDAQRTAIVHKEGPLLIVAGPGAGKTDVIVRRSAYLVLEGGIDPKSMLVTTFTNKAADELYDRLWLFLGKRSQDLHISTIHSFCQAILRDYPNGHPWGNRFEVLDDREQFLFVYARLRDLGLNRFPKSRMGDFLSNVVSTFNLCTEELVDPQAFKAVAAERGVELLGLKKSNPEAVEEYVAVAEAYSRYLELLEGESLLDFGMLQKVAYKMLVDQEDICRQVAERYHFVLVDEYQDTNRLQVLLLREITKPLFNICAVGDDDQSIYRFRGATVKSFLQFEKDFPGAETIHLDINFRATPLLVEAANDLIGHNAPHRRDKALRAHREQPAYSPILIRAETCEEEAEAVASALTNARKQGVIKSYSDVAVLFRSVKYHAPEYIKAFDRHDIPYTVASDGGFFDREDVLHLKDLITFCGWKHKWDPLLFEGKLLELHPSTIKAIAHWKEDPSAWVDESTLKELGVADPGDRRALRDIADLRIQTQSGNVGSLLVLFYDLLQATGYFHRCCKRKQEQGLEVESEGALLNLAQFSQLLFAFQQIVRTQNTYRFGDYLRTLPERSLDALRPEPSNEAVRVSTVHQAKGLEFPVVVIGSAMKGRFPGRFWPARYPIPPELRLSGEHDDTDEHSRDQRRLFYVGFTRAQDLLIVGAPNKVVKRGSGPSEFILETGQDRFTGPGLLRAESTQVSTHHRPRAPLRQRLSFSALHSYLLCPFQYKLLYDCGFAVPQAHWSQFGLMIHRVLEVLHRRAQEGKKISPASASLVLDELWRPMRYWKPEREEALKQTGREYLIRYCETHSDRFDRVHWVEEPIEMRITDSAVITGRIDLACTGEGGLEIIDFKVRSRKGLDILRPDLQVQTYGLACQEGKNVGINRLVVHLLAEPPGSDQEVFSWGRDAAESINKKLQEAIESICEGLFEPHPGPHCNLCDFQVACPSSETHTIRIDHEGTLHDAAFGACP